MSPEEVELLKPLIDTQPAYNIIHIIAVGKDAYPAEVVAMARYKLQQSAKTLRETAKYIEAKLKEFPADK